MRRRVLTEIVEALDEAASPGTAKNVYEAYSTHRRKEKKAEDLLVSLCTKLAFNIAIKPRVPPGAARSVGKLKPSGVIGAPSVPPAVTPSALSSTASGGVLNPRRSIQKSMTAMTTMAAP